MDELVLAAAAVELDWVARTSAGRGGDGDGGSYGSVAVVTDGHRLLVTSLRDAAVPPPMCHVSIDAGDAVVAADVAAHARREDGEELDLVAAVTCAGRLVVARRRRDARCGWL